jgi:hypothetical protein
MSNGFHRSYLEARLNDEGFKVADEEIKTIQTLRPQLHFPCRIAVALRGSNHHDARWTYKDRQQMEAWFSSLVQEGIATDVVFIPRMFASGETLKELRAAAAKVGADALLVIRGGGAAENRLNALAMLNVTVVGGFLVPGSHSDALYRIEAGLVDVNNGYLYATMEAEGEGMTLAPTFLIEDREAIECAKQEALKAFGPEVLQRMRGLRTNFAPVAQPLALRRQQPVPVPAPVSPKPRR